MTTRIKINGIPRWSTEHHYAQAQLDDKCVELARAHAVDILPDYEFVRARVTDRMDDDIFVTVYFIRYTKEGAEATHLVVLATILRD